jgi:hypothetical protein
MIHHRGAEIAETEYLFVCRENPQRNKLRIPQGGKEKKHSSL